MTKYTPEQLKEKAAKMQAYLERELPAEPNELIDCLDKVDILMAQSGQMLADAKYYKDTVVNGAIMQAIKEAYNDKLSASTINKYVESVARDQAYLVNWIDRINATATHHKDSIRTIISYRKKELEL